MNQAMIDGYRVNIEEARRELRAAGSRCGRLRTAGLIFWGKVVLKSGSTYDGWCVKGKIADEAYSEWSRCESNLAHWARLLAQETSTPLSEMTTKPATPPVTEEEKRAFVERWKPEVEARMADPAPQPPDPRLPPEKDDDEIPF